MVEIEVSSAGEGKRLDAWLAGETGKSRSEIERLIESGAVLLDGSPAAKNVRLRAGQVVELGAASPPETRTDAPYRTVWEDSDIIVVSKPAGVVVHPGGGTRTGTLVEAVGAATPLAAGADSLRPGVVHRLDKDTSGLLVLAKTEAALRALVAMMKERRIERVYFALAWGTFAMPTGRIEAPVGRSSAVRARMEVSPGGRPAITEFKVIEEFRRASLLEVTLATGRTHQIRVHLAHIGHPVVGDRAYGGPTLEWAQSLGLRRPFLHAVRLAFAHPLTGEGLEFEDPLGDDLARVLALVRKEQA